MITILRKTLLLLVMTVFAVGTAMAQYEHDAMDVVPASKGALPTDLPVVAQAEEGRFGGLQLDRQTIAGVIVNGHYTYQAWLKFPTPDTYGADYYTLEYNSSIQGWTPYSDDKYVYDNATPELPNTYRLVIHGGPMNGYISNEVYVGSPAIGKCRVRGWGTNGGYGQNFVGIEIEALSVSVDRHDYPEQGKTTSFTKADNVYNYQWYRRNPNTGEMTPIKGATSNKYTPTIEEVGYNLVVWVSGDDRSVSFIQSYDYGTIEMTIPASIAYLDDNGFLLNTEYVIPNPGENIIMSRWDENAGEQVTEPLGDAIKEVKPGQYAVTMDRDKYDYSELTCNITPFYLSFVYTMTIWDENGEITGYTPWYREAQVMSDRYFRPLKIKPMVDGKAVSTTVDILGRGADGNFNVVATITPDDVQKLNTDYSERWGLDVEEGSIMASVFKGKYYVRAHAIDGTLDTYYPNALVWNDANTLEPIGQGWDTEWQPTTATIRLKEALPPLQGNSVIEGKITVQTTNASRTRSSGETYTVYLKDKSNGNIIAQTQTDTNGNFKFENVPVGDYIVVPNIDGFKAEDSKPVEVAVTQENQTITNADCTVSEANEEEIYKAPVKIRGDVNNNSEVDATDVISVINFIMGRAWSITEEDADVNGDKVVNVADILQILNAIQGN